MSECIAYVSLIVMHVNMHYEKHFSQSPDVGYKKTGLYQWLFSSTAPTGNHDKTLLSRQKWPQMASAGFVGNKFQRGGEVDEAGASRLLP